MRLIITAALGFSAFALATPIVAADEPDGASQTENADSDSEMSERQRRRAERRREREEEDSSGNAFASVEAGEATRAANANEPEIVVLVEPEMECRKVTVVGSRLPKQVCTPVAMNNETARRQEAQAEELLRRTRARSTENSVSTTGREQPLTPSLFD